MTQPANIGGKKNPIWTDILPGQDLDHFSIGTDPSPGQCTILRAPNMQDWQIRKGNALTGAVVVPMGEDCNEIEILISMWLPAQIDAWKAFAAKWFRAAVVSAQTGTTKLALSIYHPILALPPVSITKVVYKSCTSLEIDDYDGWSCTVTFLKYRKPFIAPSRPLATIPSAAAAQPTAQDQAQALIQQQQAQIANLAPQLFGAGS